MLVLSRRLNESIKIGPNVVVTVCEIKGGRVRIGIEAPQSVRLMRTELEREDNAPPPIGGIRRAA